jgi:hypothetical protein
MENYPNRAFYNLKTFFRIRDLIYFFNKNLIQKNQNKKPLSELSFSQHKVCVGDFEKSKQIQKYKKFCYARIKL